MEESYRKKIVELEEAIHKNTAWRQISQVIVAISMITGLIVLMYYIGQLNII